MRFRDATLLALLMAALISISPTWLATDGSSVFAGPAVGRTLTGHTVAGHPAIFALTRDVALEPARDALVVHAPALGYSQAEVTKIRAFLLLGGHVLVADDRGAGSALLVALDVGVRLGTAPIYTPSFVDDATRVLAVNEGIPTLPDHVVVHKPFLVEGGRTLLRTPEPTWLDENANDRPDLDETLIDGALAVEANIAQGRLIVVGSRTALDPSSPLASAFFDLAAAGGRRLVIDEAHRGASDPLSIHPILSGHAGTLATAAILMLTAAIAAYTVLRPRVRGSAKPMPRPLRTARDPDIVDAIISELEP